MKNALAFVTTATLGLATVPGRADPPTDSVYFEAHVGHGADVTVKAHALVKMGSDAELSFPTKEGRFTFKYTVRPGMDGAALVIATGLLDGRIVTAGTLTVPHQGKTAVALQGAGYDWKITGERGPRELPVPHNR